MSAQIDTTNFAEYVQGYPGLQAFAKKHTSPKEYVDPYTYQKQLTLVLMNLDLDAPDSAIINIGCNFRQIGKSVLMTMLNEHMQGLQLTFNLTKDAKEITRRRAQPDAYERFNDRPFLWYDIDKDEANVLGGKVGLGPYLEALSNGAKVGGSWNETSKPIILIIGNDHLTLESLGNFSAQRIHFYTIESVGEMFRNSINVQDYPDYKLIVNQDLMSKMVKKADEQARQGSFTQDAAKAGQDTDVYIFLSYFNIIPYVRCQMLQSQKMKAKVVAQKLVELSPEHFSSFLSASGASFHKDKFLAWYEEKKDKLGDVPIKMWEGSNTQILNVQLKVKN